MKRISVLYLLVVVLCCVMGFSGEAPKIGVFFIEIIIKVKPDVIIMPEGSYKAPIDEIEIKSEGLRELNKKFNLITIERMFHRKKSKEEIAKEYPEREERAPEVTEEVDLENVFLLKFPEHIDPDEIISEYEKLEEVIYAEENKRVEIF